MMPFARVPNWIIDSGAYAKLSPSAKALLPVLGRCLASKDDHGSISIDRACDLSGLKQAAVYKAMKELTESEILSRDYGKSTFRFHECGNSDSTSVERVSTSVENDSTSVESHPYRSRSSFKNDYQEGEPSPIVDSQPEADQRKVYRAIEILNEQTDSSGKPIWRPYTNEVRRLARVWVLENHRDPEDLPALVRYGAEKARGRASAYIARVIEGGNWETPQEPPVDAERAEKVEALKRFREQRKETA